MPTAQVTPQTEVTDAINNARGDLRLITHFIQHPPDMPPEEMLQEVLTLIEEVKSGLDPYRSGAAKMQNLKSAIQKLKLTNKKTAQVDYDDEETEETLAIKELAEEENEDFDELIDNIEEGTPYPNSITLADKWILFRNEEQAEQAAVAYVKDMLETESEVFNQDWFLGQIDNEKAEAFFRDVYNEWNSSYAYDIENEASSDPDFENRLEEEMAREGVSDIDDFVEAMTNSQIAEGNGGLEHYRSNFGEKEANKLIIDQNLIDIDAAAQDAVDTDGWAHFLSHYDRNYNELPSGAVYFRA